MNKILKALAIPTCLFYLSGCEHPEHASVQPISELKNKAPLTIATWNIEHLAYPSDTGCKPRNQEDIEKLRTYAKNLDASIIALQEVASKEALKSIFPENNWQLIMSDREDSPIYECRESRFQSTQQKVAFAVRKSIPVVDIKHNNQFNLDIPGLRNGLAITVNTPLGNTEILNVHLKSGCFVNDYAKSGKKACQVLEKQAPILDSWLEQRERIDSPYIILGDFNHRLSTPDNHFFQVLNNNSNKKEPSLHLATENLKGCHPRYPEPIDHIVIGGTNTDISKKSASVHSYINMNEDEMLSDHCAISISL
ncbi:hypothetical protein CJF42_05955 [Pseudoalteromonas sp. NBT06-2]|uniref:endonuclease/exonuclease/phosphatase family protein n=1 Tax=Pseudoalteromonas sp. NBT06-2 TaxID=2025950 RepID=UPI000BA597F2|nr:endonuclease/exonuclease/phosphatase family protein [Pseudoalteromonas sp. NBT06-2]PAJ75303.1 hypothetical protein CJF42_05955 [Pseudoalteromonas sp. NBT06-2]